jgi:hypothetical protein
VHAPQLVPPAAHCCSPVPFATAQARVPAGLLHACDVTDVPHTELFVGVHPCDVTGEPPHVAVPVGVQLCVLAGLLPAPPQSASATVLPRLSRHTTVRLCDPVFAFQAQLELRDCVPLFAVKPQVALRVCVPAPAHTAVTEHALHAP